MAERLDQLLIVDGDNVAHVRGGPDDYQEVRAQLATAVIDHAARSGVEKITSLSRLTVSKSGTLAPGRREILR